LSAAETAIIDAVNTFAFDLVREATRGLPVDSNAFLSPLSASMALGMALNGANGETYAGMHTALRLQGMSEADINQGYHDLITLLSQLDSRTEMRIANSMWGHSGFAMEPAFIDNAKTFFDAEVQTLDFADPAAVSTINDWVSTKTNGKIPQLLDQIESDEVLFLINAIYFKGSWRDAFERQDTREEPFHSADGRDRTASLMNQTDTLRYQETNDYQAVELLYGNGAFAMTVLLPQPGRTSADVLAGLNPSSWGELASHFVDVDLHLTLPRFRLEYGRRLNDDLAALGMDIAFDPGRADFYRIADVRPERLYLTRVDQRTFVDVNEEGTEAAAATNVGVGLTSAPPTMRVDRPFVFVIHERLSGTVLFLGVMNVVGT
jgi:serpin B